MRALVRRALVLWEAQFLYGEFRGVLVSDSTQADVIAVWASTVPPDAAPDTSSRQVVCDGLTTFPATDQSDTLLGPIRIELDVFAGSPTPEVLAACMQRAALHEMGHALGLAPFNRHSTFNTNVMFSPPLVNVPNEGDRRTAELLYHTRPTIHPPRR